MKTGNEVEGMFQYQHLTARKLYDLIDTGIEADIHEALSIESKGARIAALEYTFKDLRNMLSTFRKKYPTSPELPFVADQIRYWLREYGHLIRMPGMGIIDRLEIAVSDISHAKVPVSDTSEVVTTHE